MPQVSGSVSESTEAEIIALFAEAADRHVPAHERGLSGPDARGGLVVANGDDAAVFRAAARGGTGGADVVASTDMIVEGTHFRREWSSPEQIGARAIAQACSDISAMGASSRYVVLAVCLPPELPLDDVARLAEGAAAEARAAGARIIGGDVTTGPVLVLAPMALGEFGERGEPGGTEEPRDTEEPREIGEPGEHAAPRARAVPLSGARPGDILALTGFPGRAAAGLALLSAGIGEDAAKPANAAVRAALATFRVPSPPYALGPAAAAAGAVALTDVTDGLLRDLAGLCSASGVAAELDSSALPDDPVLAEVAALLGDPAAEHSWRLTGGEDHGLLAAFPPAAEPPEGFVAIGVIRELSPRAGAGAVLLDGEPAHVSGWDSARGAQSEGSA